MASEALGGIGWQLSLLAIALAKKTALRLIRRVATGKLFVSPKLMSSAADGFILAFVDVAILQTTQRSVCFRPYAGSGRELSRPTRPAPAARVNASLHPRPRALRPPPLDHVGPSPP